MQFDAVVFRSGEIGVQPVQEFLGKMPEMKPTVHCPGVFVPGLIG